MYAMCAVCKCTDSPVQIVRPPHSHRNDITAHMIRIRLEVSVFGLIAHIHTHLVSVEDVYAYGTCLPKDDTHSTGHAYTSPDSVVKYVAGTCVCVCASKYPTDDDGPSFGLRLHGMSSMTGGSLRLCSISVMDYVHIHTLQELLQIYSNIMAPN